MTRPVENREEHKAECSADPPNSITHSAIEGFEGTLSESRQAYFRRKYFVERVIGCVLLVPAYPLIWVLAVVIRCTSKGNGFYRQVRVGHLSKNFEIIKLRTMRIDAEGDGKARWCVKDDPRVTRLGKWMRKLHLDELPQLINVAKGEMCLVGPRPERPVFVDRLKLEIPHYERRLDVMPGITGLSQINLPPDETLDDVRRKQYLDLLYMEQACFWLDFRMVVGTCVRLFGIPGSMVIKMLGLSRRVPTDLATISEVQSEVETVKVGSATKSDRSPISVSDRNREVVFGATSFAFPLDRPVPARISNALTVDVEDYFQVSGFEHRVDRKDWESYPSRVERSTERLLELFARKQTKGTFFILGWIAEKYPQLVKRIADGGHEIGCHSYLHRLVYQMTPDEFRDDLRHAKCAIEDACGVEVKSYRAPSFSITSKSMWAIPILLEEGFTVDSSMFPMKHDRYGIEDSTSHIHRRCHPAGELLEYPLTVWKTGYGSFPVGGGYFRLFPLWLTQKAIDASRSQGMPAMFYVHPWEVDPEHPKIDGIEWKNWFRHRVGQSNTFDKLERLLSTNRFAPIATIFNQLNRSTSSELDSGSESGILELAPSI